MWIRLVAVMLRPGYELRLWRFENKHTSQIELGEVRLEPSQKIISNLRRLIHFSSTHICSWLSVYNMCPCLCLSLANA